jgi:hypothetical protein
MSTPWRSLKGCGLNRETQSIELFRTPGIEALYSGLAITNASLAVMRSRINFAAVGSDCLRGQLSQPCVQRAGAQ